MKTLLPKTDFLLFFLLFFSGCGSGAQAPAVKKTVAPPLEISQQHDFGVVELQDTYFHDFEIHNTTNREMVIKSISWSCKCTTGSTSKSTIEPNGKGIVRVKYNSPQKSTNDQRSVLVAFTDDTIPNIRLKITAKVRSPVTILPDTLSMVLDPSTSSRVEKPLIIENHSGQRWDRIEAKCDNSIIEAEFIKTTTYPSSQSIEDWAGTLKIDASRLVQEVSTNLVVTAHANEKSYENVVPILIQPRKWLIAAPASLYIGDVKRGEIKHMELLLVLTEHTEAKGSNTYPVSLHVKHDTPGIKVPDIIHLNDRASKIHFDIDTTDMTQGYHKGNIYLESNSSTSNRLIIPYVIKVNDVN